MSENVIPGIRQSAGPPNAEHREAGRRGLPLSGSGSKDLGTGEDSQEGSAEDPGAEAFPAAEGQVGLGVDIVEIARMRRILERTPSFRTRVFSESERAYCDGTANPEVHYATRFAAREAVLKALGTGFAEGIGVRDVEVRRNAKGRPYAVLTGRAKAIAAERGVRELPLSLSYTHTDAVACAMAITEDSVRASEGRVDPMEELARRFKEARSLLDEMEAPKPAVD